MRRGSTLRMRRTRNQREAADVAANDGARNPASTLRFLRVEEAPRILRIGRSAAYEQANRWIATNGQCGLPAVKVGRMIRIPAAVLEAWRRSGETPSRYRKASRSAGLSAISAAMPSLHRAFRCRYDRRSGAAT
jgi:hypothetical protein